MPEYRAPGVYIEEIDPGPRPIEGVATTTAGFVGETERGTTRPTLVTGWLDFVRHFGGHVDVPGNTSPNVYLPYAVQGFFENGGKRLCVARVTGATPTQTAVGSFDGTAGATIIRAIGPGAWGNRLRIQVGPASGATGAHAAPAQRFRIRIVYYRDAVPDPLIDPTDPVQHPHLRRREPDVLEDFDQLIADSTHPNFAPRVINAASHLIQLDACPSRPHDVAFADGALRSTVGVDVPADLRAFIGAHVDPSQRTGLEALMAMPDIALMAVPDEIVDPGLSAALLERCESAKDRFAILNAHTDSSDIEAIAVHPDSSYGALYTPRLRVPAPHTSDGHRVVPPAGHIAGIYARTDTNRGVHKAPANELVRGILTQDLDDGRGPLTHVLGNREQDLLNPRGLNVIRDFRSTGRGVRVWGARTMASDPMLRYVNVRRLLIFLERSIDRGTQWVVFEPNTERTWTQVRNSIASFLNESWRGGALQGTQPDEGFFVRCDRTTMTQDDIDNGRLICLVGVAPVKPAEFVIFRIGQKTR